MISKPQNEAALLKGACFQRTSQGGVFGVSFALSDAARLLASYAYLSHVEMPRSEELIFHYSFGEVRARGQNLQGIYDAAHQHELVSVCCRDRNNIEPAGTWVGELVFTKSDIDGED